MGVEIPHRKEQPPKLLLPLEEGVILGVVQLIEKNWEYAAVYAA